MDARPYLEQLAGLLHKHNLEAILIGNAAAALQGAPVTMIDIDFYFRKTPKNIVKLKALSLDLEAVIMRPYYPVSDMFRLSRDRDGRKLTLWRRLTASPASLTCIAEPAGSPLATMPC